jgi:dTDP-4-amino-4,6-dideoxygalactose transaminase
MKKIPFSPPYIDQGVYDEVRKTLESGWITTGPKVKEFERALAERLGRDEVIPVNSWTSGAILALKWLGLKEGDEVILPAYTYAATALAVIHAGGKPIIVDVKEDFNIDSEKVKEALTKRTKCIIGVDFGGYPANYPSLFELLKSGSAQEKFVAENEVQNTLGRPMILADAAHSFGASRNGILAGSMADVTVFSFHAVKNLTTAEGGAIVLNLPTTFDAGKTLKWFQLMCLNGQTKSALEKSQGGNWKYDIVLPGLKINLPDVLAAIGLAQLSQYDGMVNARKKIFDRYVGFFGDKPWTITPNEYWTDGEPSFHLYPLRLEGFTEEKRDCLIDHLNENGVASNVHFIPLSQLTLFKEMGYAIEDHPKANELYRSMISLPIYPGLSETDQDYVLDCIQEGVLKILG